MIDIGDYCRRVRRRLTIAGTLFIGGALLLVVDYTTQWPTAEKGEFAAVWLFAMAVGAYFYVRSMELPVKEIMQLAETKGGVLTLSEICTAVSVNPDVALKTLGYLQRLNVAAPRWEELQKNLWEFPDVVKLPIAQAIEMAKKSGGKLRLQDLVASGHSLEVAEQTFDALAEKGLAHAENTGAGRCVSVGAS